MRHSRIMSLAIIVVIMAGLIAGCTPAEEPAAPAATDTPAAAAEPTTAPAKTNFVVATDAAFPPMEFVDESKAIVGFDVDLMEAIAAEVGFTVEWKNTAWDGIFAGLESGDYDAIMSAVTINDERKEKYDFSDPYINAGQAVIVLMDETTIASDADLTGKTVGAQIGTTGAFAVEDIDGATLKEYDTIDLALLDLVNGNLDAVVVDTPVAADYALQAETFAGKLKIVGEPFTEEYYGVVARKGDDALLSLFNEGLKAVQASGAYDEIYTKWISGEGVEKVESRLPQPEWDVAVIPAGKTIKIGQAGPMTGDYAAFGVDIARGAELAVMEKPEIKGFTVEFVTEDTQGSPEQGAAVANLFAADPQMVGIEGHVFSGSTEAAIPIYEKAGIVMVSPSATTPSLTELGSKVFNRVAFTDLQQGEFAAKYLYDTLGVRNIVTMHDGGAYGQGLATYVADAFTAMGGTVLGTEAITPGETDYSAPLAAISALGPELIYFGGYDADAAVLVSQMAGAGLSGTLFFGCDGTYGENYINLAGPAAEGTFSTYVPIPESEAFDLFREKYQSEFGDEQGALSPFSPHGHDSMALILNAIEQVAEVQDDGSLAIPRQALAETVRSTKNFPGLTGTINCSAKGECAAADVQFMIVQDGKWIEAEGMPVSEPAEATEGIPAANPDAASLLRGIEAVDEYTVKFYLNRSNASFINTLGMGNFGIMSPAAVEEYGPDIFKNPVGSGPFIFKEWVVNDKITLTANEDYWGGAPKIKTLIYRSIPDNTARFLELQAGSIDGMDNVNPDDVAVAEADENLQILWRPANNVGYLGINQAMEPFGDVKVRQAIAHAIDKQAIADAFYAGFGQAAKEFMPPSLWGYDDTIEDYAYDPAKAKELLAEAGYPDGFETELWVMPVSRPYFPQPAQVGEAIQQFLADVGITATIVQHDWGTYLDKIDAGGEHKLFMLGWTGDNGDPDNFLCVFFCGNDNSFNMGPADPELADLLQQAVQEIDQPKRQAMYEEANQMAHDIVPGVPIAHSLVPLFFKTSVQNYIPSPMSLPRWDLAWNEAGDTVIFGRGGDSVGLDPANITDGESLKVSQMILDTLVAFEPGTTNPVPGLATEWSASDDGLEWTFTLREGVMFHDGTPLNADAVVFNFTRWWDPDHPYHFGDWTWDYWAYMFNGFKGE